MGFSASDGVPFTQASANLSELLIDDAKRGLADITYGRTFTADAAIAQFQQHRSGSGTKVTHRQPANEKATKKRG